MIKATVKIGEEVIAFIEEEADDQFRVSWRETEGSRRVHRLDRNIFPTVEDAENALQKQLEDCTILRN